MSFGTSDQAMTTDPSPGTSERARPERATMRDYIRLTKLTLNLFVVITTLAGFVLASGAHIDWILMLWTGLGTGLAALGSSGMNQLIERERDARMERTRMRPLPANRLVTSQVLAVSLLLGFTGDLLLFWKVNWLTALLALIVQVIYIALYTPLKSRSTLATVVGGICGALPPMMGFSAVTGGLPPGAWMLGAVLFAWQVPHFLALAWMYRKDYARGGIEVLPNADSAGQVNANMLLFWSVVLAPLSLLVIWVGIGGWFYAIGALILGGWLISLALKAFRERTHMRARSLFFGTVIYLPILLLLMVVDTSLDFRQLSAWTRSTSKPPATVKVPVELNGFNLSTSLIPADEIVEVLDRDSIKALVEPGLIYGYDAAEYRPGGHHGGKFLVAGDRVIGVSLNGESRAYPLRFLNWHEIVNDELGDQPIVVTYCPLCDSALVFERETGSGVMEFGVSGLIYNSNLLMYNRREDGQESLWSQLLMKAVTGPAATEDRELRMIPAEMTRWGDWFQEHPETTVITGRSEVGKIYQRNPYGHYFITGKPMFPTNPPLPENSLPPLTQIAAIRSDDSWQVFRYDSAHTDSLSWADDELGLRFEYEPVLPGGMVPPSLRIYNQKGGPAEVVYALWFSWYAAHPDLPAPELPEPLNP